MPLVDRTGQKFGKLTVLDMVPRTTKKTFWRCICECGNVVGVRSDHLTDGHTQSCGCYNVDSHITHGKKNTRLYKIYWSMISRCNYEKDHNYCGRGITVCDEWTNSFETFYNWAVENGYNDKLSIDRIDVNGNYEPSNCRWATKKQQDRNKRTNVFVPHNGKTITLIELSEVTGLSYNVICKRYANGDRGERLTRPVRKRRNKTAI